MSRSLCLPTIMVLAILGLLCPCIVHSQTPPMTAAEALAEQQRLQTVHTYVSSYLDSVYQTNITNYISQAAAWVSSPGVPCTGDLLTDCGSFPSWTGRNGGSGTRNMCCGVGPGGPTPLAVIPNCESAVHAEGHNTLGQSQTECIYGCPGSAQCSVATYQAPGASVCGVDSASAKIAALPLNDLTSGCSFGPAHALDGLHATVAVTPDEFFADAAANVRDWTHLWTNVMLNFAVITNAANVSSSVGDRAKVTVESTAGLFLAYKTINNGHFVVDGSATTHFVAVDPTDLATADKFELVGGDATLLGAATQGTLNATTTGAVRMLNVVNTGNVNLTGSTDVFIGNVVISSGEISAAGTSSSDSRVLYNVSATGGRIHAKHGKSALYSVDTSAGATIELEEGTHFVSDSANAGTLTVSSCTYVNFENVSNTGTISITGCATINGSMVSNNGGTVSVSSGAVNVEFAANTGSIVLAAGVTGRILVPYGTTVTAPATVTVDVFGAPPSTLAPTVAPTAVAASSPSGSAGTTTDAETGTTEDVSTAAAVTTVAGSTSTSTTAAVMSSAGTGSADEFFAAGAGRPAAVWLCASIITGLLVTMLLA